MANDYVGWGLILGIEDSLDDFINDATEVVNSLGTGLPPRDLAAFSSQSTEDGIKLTFTPPAQTYIDDGGTNQFAVMPAGVLIRYSDTGYPRTPDEGKFGYDYKPTGDWVTTSQECTIVGLTKDTKYYFTAFPYSTEHVYNKNQVTANRTEMTWVGNKGTISVTVQTPEGYEGTLGEYTITLVDQASGSPQNVEKTATGAGLTQFGGLTAGKSYKVRLSSTADLQAPPDSEVITIVGGVNYDVTMTYALMYGTITVNVTTQPAGMPIGAYTVTLTPQGGGDALQQSGNNSQAVVFSNVKNGTVYTVGLSAINHYTANPNGTVTAVGGQNISHSAQYVFSATLDDLSWAEIKQLADSGMIQQLYSIGDSKGFGNYTAIIAGFEVDVADSQNKDIKAPITFTTDYLYEGQVISDRQQTFLNNAISNFNSSIPSDLKSVIRPIYKAEFSYFQPTAIMKKYDYGFIPQAVNYFGGTTLTFEPPEGFDGSDFSTNLSEVTVGKAVQYPYFTSSSRRKMNNPYLTSSPVDNEYYRGYAIVDGNGNSSMTVRNTYTGYARMAFCI